MRPFCLVFPVLYPLNEEIQDFSGQLIDLRVLLCPFDTGDESTYTRKGGEEPERIEKTAIQWSVKHGIVKQWSDRSHLLLIIFKAY